MNTALKCTFAMAGWALVLAMTGCDADTAQTERTGGTPRARSTVDFASRRIEGVGAAQVKPVAERVFHSYFRVDSSVSTGTDLVAFPTDVRAHEATAHGEEPAAEEPGSPPPRHTVGDVIGVAPRRYRRIADLRWEAADNGVMAQVRVMFQRLTTTERTAFARERGDDRPTDTAIDRLGPASPSSRDEWRDDRRDKRLEQEILNAIEAGLVTTRPAEGG